MAVVFLRRALMAKTISRSFMAYSSLTRFRPLFPLTDLLLLRFPTTVGLNCFSSCSATSSSSFNDSSSPNWKNRPPPKECTPLYDGCDFEHWLIVMDKPEVETTRDELIDSYIKTLAMVVGSEEEARKLIYSVSTRHYFAFGCNVSEEVSFKIKQLPKVLWVLPDSYLDVENKDYGGEPFINGEAVPYDPKYHKEWVKNNTQREERASRNDTTGWGRYHDVVFAISENRNAAERKYNRQVYAESYGEDLRVLLNKEPSSDFERIIRLRMLDPAWCDAFLVNEATKRCTSSKVIMEIACTRSSDELFLVRQAYHYGFKKSLEEDVASHTIGNFRKLLVPLVSSYRYEGPEVDMTLATSEAKILHTHISDKTYNHDEIIRILTTRSKPQLLATFDHYNNEFGNAITKDLKADASDDFLTLVRSTIRCLIYPEKYFEKVLRKAINKVGTDEWALTRVIATRADIDMEQIKEEYHRKNGVSLDDAIKGDTSGDYQELLLALLGS